MKDFGQWFKSLGQVPEVPEIPELPIEVMDSDGWITYTTTSTSTCPAGLEKKMVEVKLQRGTAFTGGSARLGQDWGWFSWGWNLEDNITHYRVAK